MTPITMTPDAITAIKNKTAAKNGALGLRLTIKSTGCSGHSYHMDYAMAEDAGDDRIAQDGATLYVPKMHSWMLFGMVIGYEETKMGSGFTFTNPNESGRCGCGESFSVDRIKV